MTRSIQPMPANFGPLQDWLAQMGYDKSVQPGRPGGGGGGGSTPNPSTPPANDPPPSGGTAPEYDRDAFALLEGMLREWGLSQLVGTVRDMLIDGVEGEIVPIRLRETEAYKKRFAGNLNREKNGLPVLSEADYLAAESAMKTVLRRYGGENSQIKGLDAEQQIVEWISKDVSPQELSDRFKLYQDNYVSSPQWVKDAWSQHGLTPWQAMMAAADASLSETDLTNAMNTYALGSQALQAYGDQRFDFQSDRFEEYAQQGVTANQARDGFEQVAAREQYEGFLAGISGTELTREEQERDALFGDGDVRKKRERLLAQDQGRFSENFLGGQNALSRSSQGDY